MLALVLGMAVTGNVAPVLWYITERAAAIQEDVVTPMLEDLARIPVPAGATIGTP